MLELKGFPSAEEVHQAEADEKPLVLAPSVKALCNYRCITCYVRSGERVAGEIGLKDHKSAIEQMALLGVKYAIIAMVGEPFLDPAFFDKKKRSFPLIDYANEHGIYVVVFTNSSLLTPEILEQLKGKNVSLIGKLWSLKPDVDDELTGKKKKWVSHNGVLIPEGLKFMVDAGFNRVENRKTRLGIDVIVTAKNYEDIPDIVKYAIASGIKPVIDTMIPTERAQRNYETLKLADGQNRWLYDQLVRILGDDFVNGQFVEGCAVRRAGFAYDNLGNVKVCCALGADVGNIKDRPIAELYAEIQEYRRKLPTYPKEAGRMNACDIARLVKERLALL